MAGLLQFSDAWVSVFPCSLVTSFSWHLSFWGLSANAETHRMKMSNSLRILYFIFHEVRKLQCLFHFMPLPPAHLYTVRESSLSFIMWQNLTQGIWNRSFILSGQTAQSQTPLWSPHGQMGGQPLVLWTDANFREKTKTETKTTLPLPDSSLQTRTGCLQMAAFQIPPQMVLNPLLAVQVEQ